MLTVLWLVVVLLGMLALAYVNAAGIVWSALFAAALGVAWVAHLLPGWLSLALGVAVRAARDPAQRSDPAAQARSAMRCSRAFRKVLPPMSQTEREAIEAGTVWWDGELFSGRPAVAQAARRAGANAHGPTSSTSSTTRPRSCARW